MNAAGSKFDVSQLPLIRKHFTTFGAMLPKALSDELAALEARLA